MLKNLNLDVTSGSADICAILENYYKAKLNYALLNQSNTTNFVLELTDDINYLSQVRNDEVSFKVLESIFDFDLLLVDGNLQFKNTRFDLSKKYKQKYIVLVQLFNKQIRHKGFILYLLVDMITSLKDLSLSVLIPTLILNYTENSLSSDSEKGKEFYLKVVEEYGK